MRRAFVPIAAGVLLIAAAPVKLAPADDKPPALVGAAARAKHGPDPMAKPPADAGATEDPVTAPPTPPSPQPAAAAPSTPKR